MEEKGKRERKEERRAVSIATLRASCEEERRWQAANRKLNSNLIAAPAIQPNFNVSINHKYYVLGKLTAGINCVLFTVS